MSPKSFIITAIRYPWRSVKIRLVENKHVMTVIPTGLNFRYLTRVDFPAPRNPQMMVIGTLDCFGAEVSGSRSVLEVVLAQIIFKASRSVYSRDILIVTHGGLELGRQSHSGRASPAKSRSGSVSVSACPEPRLKGTAKLGAFLFLRLQSPLAFRPPPLPCSPFYHSPHYPSYSPRLCSTTMQTTELTEEQQREMIQGSGEEWTCV